MPASVAVRAHLSFESKREARSRTCSHAEPNQHTLRISCGFCQARRASGCGLGIVFTRRALQLRPSAERETQRCTTHAGRGS